MEHLLDNPIFHGMITGNGHLAAGTDSVRFYPKEVSPFVGLRDFDEESFSTLANIHHGKIPAVMITAKDPKVPASWKMVHQSKILQLVAEDPKPPADFAEQIIPLGTTHIPQMLELTKMTNPGPFAERTIEFGNYKGIFDGEKLVAMAGYRMQPDPYIEISAVCTHPDHTGKGYGNALMLYQAQQIIAQGNIPFLHVRKDNENAIRLYKRSGFAIRTEMHLNVFQK